MASQWGLAWDLEWDPDLEWDLEWDLDRIWDPDPDLVWDLDRGPVWELDRVWDLDPVWELDRGDLDQDPGSAIPAQDPLLCPVPMVRLAHHLESALLVADRALARFPLFESAVNAARTCHRTSNFAESAGARWMRLRRPLPKLRCRHRQRRRRQRQQSLAHS